METLTILLLCIALALFVITVIKKDDTRLIVLTMILSICSLGQIFADTELSSNQVVYCLVPIVAVLIYSAIGMMRLKE